VVVAYRSKAPAAVVVAGAGDLVALPPSARAVGLRRATADAAGPVASRVRAAIAVVVPSRGRRLRAAAARICSGELSAPPGAARRRRALARAGTRTPAKGPRRRDPPPLAGSLARSLASSLVAAAGRGERTGGEE